MKNFFGRTNDTTAAETAPLGERLQRLETLHSQQLVRRQELAAIELEVDLNRRAEKAGAVLPHMVAVHRQYEEALPKARAALKATIEAITQTHKDIEAYHAGARRAPMSESDRKKHDCAAAYLTAVAETVQLAETLAAHARVAIARGEALGIVAGGDGARRKFDIGWWRARFTAGVVRLFERDPNAAGMWGSYGALLELGPSKAALEIARNGFLETERRLVKDLLPPNVGEAL